MSDEEIMNTPISELDETEDTSEPEEINEENIEYSQESSDEPVEEDYSEENSSEESDDYYSNNNSSDYDENDTSDANSDTIQDSTENSTPNYEEFYKRVMAPFKANGKTIQLKSADEVISLMQMGTDYTKKTQDLSRYKKPMLMLEKANLLNEDNVSFFIDLMQGNQEAVRKLLKDKEIDAYSLPPDDEEINYNAGTHKITDEAIALDDTVKEIANTDRGVDFLMEMRDWDDWTKEQIYAAPSIAKALFYQKQVGVYDQVVTEVNRLKSIGYISHDTPFIKAYNYVADQMVKARTQGKNGNSLGSSNVSRRAAVTLNSSNNSRVKSAGITRTSGRSTNSYQNPLSMSDEEFLKRFGDQF